MQVAIALYATYRIEGYRTESLGRVEGKSGLEFEAWDEDGLRFPT